MRSRHPKAAAALVTCVALAGPLPAQEGWTAFRGPDGSGHAEATGLPRHWSETRNVAWKTPIHGRGWSSPVVLGDRVWLTTATPDGTHLSVLALDRDSGRVLLDRVLFEVPEPEDTRQYNSYASPTPVIGGGRVYVHFGSYGTASLDAETGELLWARRDLPCNHWRGPGSSPILWNGLLIVHMDGYDQQYVVALDQDTGRTVWRADRAHDFGTDDGDQKKGFATPIVIEAAGRQQLVSPAAKAVVSLDPGTGRELWRVRYEQHSPAARPLWDGERVYVTTGYGKASLLAIRPDGRGDVTESHVAWRALSGIGSKPSPVLVDGRIYSVSDSGGVVTCLDAASGARVWQHRVPGGAHSASLLYADGAVYVFAEGGTATALAPGPEYRLLGNGLLDEGGVMATPAIAGRAIFLRTASHLYRLERLDAAAGQGATSSR